MELVITIVGGLIATVIASYIWETKIRDRLRVVLLRDPKSAETLQLCELYKTIFPGIEVNYDVEQVVAMIDPRNQFSRQKHVRSEDLVLIAKYHREVVGFIFCHYYPDRRKAIVSYFGIDKTSREARAFAAAALVERLKGLLSAKERHCDFLFFDVERPEAVRRKEERSRRLARIKVLKQDVDHVGLQAYCLDFRYQRPKIVLSDNAKEIPLTLMVVPIHGVLAGTLPKEVVMEFLRFIYLDCYGDIYNMTSPEFAEYHKHLAARLVDLERDLPKVVGVR